MNADQETVKRQRETFAKAIRAWYAAIKNLQLYSETHPTFKDNCQKLIAALNDVFASKFELTVTHSDGLFVVDDFFFIEESLVFYDLLKIMETGKIHDVLFMPGITADEVVTLLLTLVKMSAPGDSAVPPAGAHYKITKIVEGATEIAAPKKTLLPDLESTEALYVEWLDTAERSIAKLLDEQTISIGDLATPLDQLIEQVHKNSATLCTVMSGHESRNVHVRHALHTAILSIYVGKQIGFDIASTKTLAVAALLHDIGRFLLPADFITGYKLAAGDEEFIKRHAQDGASFVAGVQGLPTVAARTALEHHIGLDGLGYPSLQAIKKPHLFSQIIGLADFVSWATVSDTFYHKPVSTPRIVRSMLRRSGSQFSPTLVKVLLPFFGLYPPGTKVALSDGQLALVAHPNPKNIARPMAVVKGTNGGFRAMDLEKESVSVKHSAGFEPNFLKFFKEASIDLP